MITLGTVRRYIKIILVVYPHLRVLKSWKRTGPETVYIAPNSGTGSSIWQQNDWSLSS